MKTILPIFMQLKTKKYNTKNELSKRINLNQNKSALLNYRVLKNWLLRRGTRTPQLRTLSHEPQTKMFVQCYFNRSLIQNPLVFATSWVDSFYSPEEVTYNCRETSRFFSLKNFHHHTTQIPNRISEYLVQRFSLFILLKII